jgi:O-antigen/teichoic acid export membrane protein
LTTQDRTFIATIPRGDVARNTVLILGFQFISKILGFVSSILLANYLGTLLFGAYNYAFALTALFIPLCDLGLDMFLLRDIPRHNENQASGEFGLVLTSKMFLGLGVVLCVAITAVLLESWGSQNFIFILIAGAITVLKTFWTSYSSVLRGLNHVMTEAELFIVARTGEFVATLYCVITSQPLVLLLVLLAAINASTLLLAHFVVARRYLRPRFNATVSELRRIFKEGIPFALTTILVAVYFNLDTVLVSKLVSDNAAGLYRAVYNLILPTMMVTAAASGAIFPFISQHYAASGETVRLLIARASRYLLLLSIPIALFCCIESRQIVAMLFSPQYAPSALSLSILVWFIPVVYLTNLFGNSLGAMDQQKYVLKVAGFNVLFNIVANLILIPKFAQNGASVVTVLTEILGLILLSTKITKYYPKLLQIALIGRIGLAMIPSVIFLLVFESLNAAVALLGAAVLYLLSVFLLKIIRKEEIHDLMIILRGSNAY